MPVVHSDQDTAASCPDWVAGKVVSDTGLVAGTSRQGYMEIDGFFEDSVERLTLECRGLQVNSIDPESEDVLDFVSFAVALVRDECMA